jgi:hypothetical protein
MWSRRGRVVVIGDQYDSVWHGAMHAAFETNSGAAVDHVLACSVEMLVLAFGYPTQANRGLEWGTQNLW